MNFKCIQVREFTDNKNMINLTLGQLVTKQFGENGLAGLEECQPDSAAMWRSKFSSGQINPKS